VRGDVCVQGNKKRATYTYGTHTRTRLKCLHLRYLCYSLACSHVTMSLYTCV
jgi:hypothetical protein